MKTKKTLLSIVLVVLLSTTCLLLVAQKEIEDTPEAIKVALREVGHNVLLANDDTVSLVLPVRQVGDSKYELKFEKPISIPPDGLVVVIEESFVKSSLPAQYLVEVKQCADSEVAYSYLMTNEVRESVIPCSNRILPRNCYIITVQFLKDGTWQLGRNLMLLLIGLLIAFLLWKLFKSEQADETIVNDENIITISDYLFFPHQNKLTLKSMEVQLSKKEGELLSMLAANLNRVVRREELAKIWEDNGVVVGRSLDTYVSKLRKRLQDDEAIRLANVHGVGYKLEVNE